MAELVPQVIEQVTDDMVAAALTEFRRYVKSGRQRASETVGMKAAIEAALAARTVIVTLPEEGSPP